MGCCESAADGGKDGESGPSIRDANSAHLSKHDLDKVESLSTASGTSSKRLSGDLVAGVPPQAPDEHKKDDAEDVGGGAVASVGTVPSLHPMYCPECHAAIDTAKLTQQPRASFLPPPSTDQAKQPHGDNRDMDAQVVEDKPPSQKNVDVEGKNKGISAAQGSAEAGSEAPTHSLQSPSSSSPPKDEVAAGGSSPPKAPAAPRDFRSKDVSVHLSSGQTEEAVDVSHMPSLSPDEKAAANPMKADNEMARSDRESLGVLSCDQCGRCIAHLDDSVPTVESGGGGNSPPPPDISNSSAGELRKRNYRVGKTSNQSRDSDFKQPLRAPTEDIKMTRGKSGFRRKVPLRTPSEDIKMTRKMGESEPIEDRELLKANPFLNRRKPLRSPCEDIKMTKPGEVLGREEEINGSQQQQPYEPPCRKSVQQRVSRATASSFPKARAKKRRRKIRMHSIETISRYA